MTKLPKKNFLFIWLDCWWLPNLCLIPNLVIYYFNHYDIPCINFLAYDTRENWVFQLHGHPPKLNHPTTRSCHEKYWHSKTYNHLINFKYLFQRLKCNILNLFIQNISSNVMVLMICNFQILKFINLFNFWNFQISCVKALHIN